MICVVVGWDVVFEMDVIVEFVSMVFGVIVVFVIVW